MVGKRKETQVFVYAKCFAQPGVMSKTWNTTKSSQASYNINSRNIALSKWTLTVLIRRLTSMMCTCTRCIRKDIVDFARNRNLMYENAKK